MKINFNYNSDYKSKVSFKARLAENFYSSGYEQMDNYNGMLPDSFALERIGELEQTMSRKLLVFDIAAGQGRNTIPIAEKGHDVFAFEINPLGRDSIRKKSAENHLEGKIRIKSSNILDPLVFKKTVKTDFTLMSHLSQHFNPKDLVNAFTNVGRFMNNNAELIMDALIRTNKEYREYEKVPIDLIIRGSNSLEEYGAASFWKKDIIKSAEQAGLNLVKEEPFKEDFTKRAWYETQALWGGDKKLPVKLTWFVFKK